MLGLSVILVTHDISVIAQTCDRMALMYAGKIVEVGPTVDVFARPQHPYTMGLQNSFPNLLRPQETLIPIEGAPPDLLGPDRHVEGIVPFDKGPRCRANGCPPLRGP